MTVRIHARCPIVEQLDAQAAKAAWQLAEVLATAAKPVVKVGESFAVAEEPQIDDTDVVMGVADEERPAAPREAMEELTSFGVDTAVAESAVASKVKEEPTIFGVDTAVVESKKKLLAATEQEVETAWLCMMIILY